MKKVICLLIALMLCVGMAVPALAVDGKPSPEFEDITVVPGVLGDGTESWGTIFENGGSLDNIGSGCLQITPISYLRDVTKDVEEEIKSLLNYLYGGLRNETIEIPYEMLGEGMNDANMIEIDFCDVRWACTEHAHVLDPKGVVITLTLDINYNTDDEVFIMVYDGKDNDWEPAVEVINNGDGTVTCTLEELGALVFAVKASSDDVVAAEESNFPVIAVAAVAVVAAGGGVALVLKGKKKGAAAAK